MITDKEWHEANDGAEDSSAAQGHWFPESKLGSELFGLAVLMSAALVAIFVAAVAIATVA